MIDPANEAPAGLTRRSLLTVGLGLVLQGLTGPAGAAGPAERGSPAAPPSVYLLRGFAGVFSTGIDEIDGALRASGVASHIGSHLGWRSVADTILQRHAAGSDGPVVLIGHSLGANAAISVAELLERERVDVRYLATFAATAPDPLPGNIDRAVNFYFSQGGWGLPLVPGPRFRGRLENRDFAGYRDVGHFNIDKQPALQTEVVKDTLRILRRG
jgi:pimeloyl-ACP methyl ester carboxylesterase